MIRNLKLGIVLTAVLATSAIGASSAQAESSLDVSALPAFLTGTQGTLPNTVNKLTITGPNEEILARLKCMTVSLQSTTTEANLKEATLTPSFGPLNTCELLGMAASVDVNGCTFTFTNTATALQWALDIVCPVEKPIEITQAKCVLTIPPQEPLGSITFATVNPGIKHVTATLNVKNISVVGDANCPANLQEEHTADLTGTQTIKAFSDETVGGIPKEGPQVNLEAT